MKARDENGVSLIEIVIAMVIISVVVTSLFAALATSSRASKSHRDVVRADAVLRDYSEATKTAVRSCTAGGTFTVVVPTLPTGYTVNAVANQLCPAVATTSTIMLTTTFNGVGKSLSVKVRTP